MANRTADGTPFNDELIQKIWEKAIPVAGEDPARIRKDICGAIIRRDEFNRNAKSLSGCWEIDHIKPLSKGGTDDFHNLQPLQWENNLSKGDEHPSWKCKVSSAEKMNGYLRE